MTAATFAGIFERLYGAFGPQHWWPASTDFEVMAGAVLTQNTAWRNVERALAALRDEDLLEPQALLALAPEALAERIRPAGYYNIKATRLRNLTATLVADGGVEAWRAWSTDNLRRRLLGVNGVGEETADSILLYVYQRPVFVIDAYTRRIFSRIGLVQGDEAYRTLAAAFEAGLPGDPGIYNTYHALIVRLGNQLCRPRTPLCTDCPLVADCDHGVAVTS